MAGPEALSPIGSAVLWGVLTTLLYSSIFWYTAVRDLGRLKEFHHFYWGWVLVLVGLACPAWALWTLTILGGAMIVDDTQQHLVQLTDPEYASPMHRAYAWVCVRWPALNRWASALDLKVQRLLGKR